MAVLTRPGRAAIAAAIKDRPIFLGWGNGVSWWDSNQNLVAAFGADERVATGFGNISSVVVKSEDGETTYSAGADYTVEPVAGRIIRSPSGSIAPEATVRVSFYVARPAEPSDAAALVAEVGRRKAQQIEFVTPDADGGIVVPTGRFAISPTPTNNLYFRFVFDFSDGSGETIKETAIFVDTVTNPDAPLGQFYFAPAEIVDPGILLVLQRSAPIIRSAATRETFEFVVTF
ncbi:hypothetical protein [Azospirillum sp. TSH64]|uniref:hypothetical protein n=1 Tax=Azospirillum sp. TSH64 TaxID=652740 RepID=UPI000D605474|nr:hypothetical protein [Azospirillum sp. TSH64]PWC81251.1 hypothetical protein TSH64_00985 [Azospirillum sp. TSH64]